MCLPHHVKRCVSDSCRCEGRVFLFPIISELLCCFFRTEGHVSFPESLKNDLENLGTFSYFYFWL